VLGAAAESLSFWLRLGFWRGPCRRQNSNAAAAATASAATAATAAAAAAAAAEQSSNEDLEALDSHTFMTVCSTEGTEVFRNIFFSQHSLIFCLQIEPNLKKDLFGDLYLNSRSVI
jgi:hypothetical protein